MLVRQTLSVLWKISSRNFTGALVDVLNSVNFNILLQTLTSTALCLATGPVLFRQNLALILHTTSSIPDK